MQLKRATRKQVKLKVGFSGASGFGKTYSALLMAYGVTGDWSKIAVIDTENGSADLYANLGEYNTLTLAPPFSPERYIEAINQCEAAGIELIIIDSITHEWEGEGGCLDIQEKLGGRYQDWAKVTPRHKAFINAILQSPCHVFTTVRRKQDYEMNKDDKGRTTVQKVGTKEVTREGFEYEITLNFEFVNDNHMVKASKDRTGLFMNKPEFVISPETGKQLMQWANDGVDEVKYTIDSINAAKSRAELTTIWNNNTHLQSNPTIEAAFKVMAAKYPKTA
ncbi:MAG: AAA family ATPase [Tenuifilaceae bacterium]|jgi:hypothetical protein|nr:AAA family ATPase [Tenuifilaceae bacterium]